MSEASDRWEQRTQLIMTRDRVRKIVDDDEATQPIGIDPETIAAARRIARRLAEFGNDGSSRYVQDQGCN